MAQLDLKHKKRISMYNSQKSVSRGQGKKKKKTVKPQVKNPAFLFKFLMTYQEEPCLVKISYHCTSNMHKRQLF